MSNSENSTRARVLPGQLVLDFDARTSINLLLTPDEIYSRANESLLRSLNEDRRIERKASRFQGSSLGEYISMWANTAPYGGIVVVGMQDKKDGGGFLGCSSLSQDELNLLEKCGYTFCPDARVDTKRIAVKNLNGADDFVVIFRVYYNESIVVKTSNGKVFKRIGDSKTELKGEMLRELQADKGEIRFEMQACGLNWPDDFEMGEIQEFCKLVQRQRGLSQDHPIAEMLTMRRLGKLTTPRKFEPNMACALLFAKDPLLASPGCKVRFQKFEGLLEETGESYNAVKDQIFEGTIPSLIVQVAQFLESQLRSFSPLGAKGKFRPVPEYPELAWYEAIVNACVHRSYGNGMKNMPIFVKMFDDRLEIESPGPFPPFVTPENIYDTHAPRNPMLMDALFYLEYVKCAHEGTRRIRDTMKEMDLPEPEFSQKSLQHAYVKVTLRNLIEERVVSKRGGIGLAKEGGPQEKGGAKTGGPDTDELFAELPEELKDLLDQLGKRAKKEMVRKAILELCNWRPLLPQEIASYLQRANIKTLVSSYISPMHGEGLLERTIPETPSHPGQKYKTSPKGILHIF